MDDFMSSLIKKRKKTNDSPGSYQRLYLFMLWAQIMTLMNKIVTVRKS